MKPDGSSPVSLAVQPYHIIAWPSFSPDGQSLAYQGVYAAYYSVHIVDLTTNKDTRLTPPNQTGVNPVFSP